MKVTAWEVNHTRAFSRIFFQVAMPTLAVVLLTTPPPFAQTPFPWSWDYRLSYWASCATHLYKNNSKIKLQTGLPPALTDPAAPQSSFCQISLSGLLKIHSALLSWNHVTKSYWSLLKKALTQVSFSLPPFIQGGFSKNMEGEIPFTSLLYWEPVPEHLVLPLKGSFHSPLVIIRNSLTIPFNGHFTFVYSDQRLMWDWPHFNQVSRLFIPPCGTTKEWGGLVWTTG